jgi:hypothetical protein
MSQGPRLQVEPFQTADSSQTSFAVINEESGAIAIDYSQYYERIAVATEQLVAKLTEIETHQKRLKELGEGDGIHIIGPWEWLGISSIVRLYEERGIDLAELKAKVDAVPKST